MGVVYLAEHVDHREAASRSRCCPTSSRARPTWSRASCRRPRPRRGSATRTSSTSPTSARPRRARSSSRWSSSTARTSPAHIKTGGAAAVRRARKQIMQPDLPRARRRARKGIIHRDLKPENVYLVTREGRADFVKVLDFGIAKLSALDEGGSRLTRTGMIFGTPEYMSPEQARGDKLDHRVDIYAIGCILFEMLTGDVPFHAETFMGVLTKHMFEEPEPPSQRAPHANIAPDVEAVVLEGARQGSRPALPDDEGDGGRARGSAPAAICRARGATSRRGRGCASRRRRSARRARRRATPSARRRRRRRRRSSARRRRSAPGSSSVAWSRCCSPAAGRRWCCRRRSREPPKPVVTAPVVAPKPTVVEAPKPVEPAKPSQYTMSINTQPAGAEVFNGSERLGVTPCNVPLPASETPVDLMLKKKGFKEQTLKIVPDKDHDYLVDLMSRPSRTRRRRRRRSRPRRPRRRRRRPRPSPRRPSPPASCATSKIRSPIRLRYTAPRCTEPQSPSRTKSRAFIARRSSSICTTIF